MLRVLGVDILRFCVNFKQNFVEIYTLQSLRTLTRTRRGGTSEAVFA
ncbi:hypothetical protein [Campylobacter troglodytis]|nr:hypothetical protein [Campylobacter troglodytis]